LLPLKKVCRIAGFEQTIPGIKHARTVHLELFENMVGKVNWCGRVGGNEIAISHHELVLIEGLAAIMQLWWLLRTSVRRMDDFALDFCLFSEL
jgi:hypothetical protein